MAVLTVKNLKHTEERCTENSRFTDLGNYLINIYLVERLMAILEEEIYGIF